MFAIETILEYYQQKRLKRQKAVLCTNTWGHQNYEGEFLNVVKRDQINYREVGERGGWMLAYVSSKLQGVRAKKRTLLEKLTFRRKNRTGK